ncbi:hypothetical protein [Chryseobacterium sp. S0630]|nr:hypothetical protein [Chryseobacterium sp. S0630]
MTTKIRRVYELESKSVGEFIGIRLSLYDLLSATCHLQPII